MNPDSNYTEEGPFPSMEPYRPNEAFARVLAAKKALDRRVWPK